ncbi:MAG: BolA family transcriptional regulator [Ancalomicrobiaceae bacterium]|nr:BolA family transcriptional regulator [Ancalomicrobiaceae bacterium]
MAMQAAEIELTIKAALPDAKVSLTDLAGDGDHWAAEVVSVAFKGLSRIKQHQLVQAAFGEKMGRELHALALKTSVPQE